MDSLEKKEIEVPILGHGPSGLQRRRVRREAGVLARRVRKALAGGELKSYESQAAKPDIEKRTGELEAALAKDDHDAVVDNMVRLEAIADKHITPVRKSTFREYFDSIIVAVLVALVLRAFVVEAFKIPSGSMIPTMEVGDHIFVNKFIYGLRIPFTKIKFFEWRKPKRGEVIVFIYPGPRKPGEDEKDFIKRIIAVEGDAVEVRDDHVYVNGKEVPRRPIPGTYQYWDYDENIDRWSRKTGVRVEEELDGEKYTTVYDTSGAPHDMPENGRCPSIYKDNLAVGQMELTAGGACLVPKGTVFCMGDNRYNSHDSRFWGPAPLENIKGKALVVWWSSGSPDGVRWGRIGHVVQ